MVNKKKDTDLRKYIRVPTVFPVEFQVVDKNKIPVWNTVYQGYTKNVNDGAQGLCLEVYNLDENLVERLKSKDFNLEIHLNLPSSEQPIKISAEPRWIAKVKDSFPTKFDIGVLFQEIDDRDKKKIVSYIKKLKRRSKQIIAFISILLLLLAGSFLRDLKLTQENKTLIKQLFFITEEKHRLDRELEGIVNTRQKLEDTLDESNRMLTMLKQQLEKATAEKIDNIRVKLDSINKNKSRLKNTLKNLMTKEKTIVKRLIEVKESKKELDKKNTEKMYQWLTVNQNNLTGLVPSFEGDPDLQDTSFTYDQALVIMNFTLNGDIKRASKLVDFYYLKARRALGAFLNAYDAVNGKVTEWTIHVGPNAWLGMALLHYYEKTEDQTALKISKEIGDWILTMQDEETGGVKGGPGITWFATEHNVDCYAYFRMLYKLTGDMKYLEAADKVLAWLKEEVYDEKNNRFFRGKKDRTIATDTVSFTVPALGVERLFEEGINPELLINFIERRTKVTTVFTNKKNIKTTITGFDYTDPRSISRKGVVSSEWTAQMIVTYNEMSNYFKGSDKEKAEMYKKKSEFYLSELDKMFVMKSYSKYFGGGLPYATGTMVNTGHGWLTPKSPFAISIAGTAYTLFARKNFNPFFLPSELEEDAS